MTYAHIEQSHSTGEWSVWTGAIGSFHTMTRTQADQIAGALNAAYARGRSDVQAELRDVIGAAAQETPT